MREPGYLTVLRERRNWLTARIEAKLSVGWDVEWDTRERDALSAAIADREAQQTASVPGQLQNCYRTSEALYHALGGKDAGLTPMQIRHEGTSHWYLRWFTEEGEAYYIDATAGQFATAVPYHLGRGCGFRTREPSEKAVPLLRSLGFDHRYSCQHHPTDCLCI